MLEGRMKIKWLGHSAFLITTASGIKIITDPYNTGSGINYKPINETAEIVTISHDHRDHNNFSVVKGSPVVLREEGTHFVKGTEIKALSVYHDSTAGGQRGNNLMFCFKAEGIVVCHAGDLGHTLSPGQINEIEKVDILLIPIGGYYTINAQEANLVIKALSPRLIIPMHYKTGKIDFPIEGIQPFLKGLENVHELDDSEIEINCGALPIKTEFMVLKPAN
jgi:L-ascorbate metabolism protein UlaG (beta-lactamase superfamily)